MLFHLAIRKIFILLSIISLPGIIIPQINKVKLFKALLVAITKLGYKTTQYLTLTHSVPYAEYH